MDAADVRDNKVKSKFKNFSNSNLEELKEDIEESQRMLQIEWDEVIDEIGRRKGEVIAKNIQKFFPMFMFSWLKLVKPVESCT